MPMPVEFLGIAATNDGSETVPRSGAAKATGRTDVPRIRVACRALWDTLSARGHDLLGDAVDVGGHVIPVVREEAAGRDAARAARRTQTLAAVGV
ncbi:alkanesulfonate monooxygenase [Streptomyces parvulus]|uniref:alkanesulfonate monooxygenase n=1 Tax=Streptomyces parvulus TaxID=146923 RepID=UPI003F4DD4A1